MENLMTYRSLLVLLDSSPLCASRVDCAIRIAKSFEAHLVGLAPTGIVDMPVATESAASLAEYATLAWNTLRAEAAQSVEQFRQTCRAAGFQSFETQVDDESKARSLVSHAHCSDLTVLSQADPSSPGHAAMRETVEQVILYSARPTLVLPYAGRFDTVGTTAMVAWDNSREAARAVADALPFLRAAQTVHVVSWEEQRNEDGGLRPSLDALQRWLMWQGVTAEIHVERSGIPIAQAMLSRAADLSADLIVMGAYGHARWSERLLGGATRGLLDAMTAPVLMSH
ncbi:universal stress protein [Albitalea terrae]|uniref:Universal stress protein n=2 Tax=Piscinibacter terrae TaxID=2496871 RepID=A0A3N7HM80_9BURK|nr:universal stress protein [Albitalea terrae]